MTTSFSKEVIVVGVGSGCSVDGGGGGGGGGDVDMKSQSHSHLTRTLPYVTIGDIHVLYVLFTDNVRQKFVPPSTVKMPKKAKKTWRKKINLDDIFDGVQRTRKELAEG
jgi:hypothetical protein